MCRDVPTPQSFEIACFLQGVRSESGLPEGGTRAWRLVPVFGARGSADDLRLLGRGVFHLIHSTWFL